MAAFCLSRAVAWPIGRWAAPMRLLLVAFASATVGTAGVGLTAVDAARNRALALQAEQAEPGAHRSSAVNASSTAANASSGAVTFTHFFNHYKPCLLYTSPSPRDKRQSRMPSSA